MTDNLNVHVLVAAKEEYTHQLIYLLSPEIYKVLYNVYNDSQKLKKKDKFLLKIFRFVLKRFHYGIQL